MNTKNQDTDNVVEALLDASNMHYGLVGPMVVQSLCSALDADRSKTIEQLDMYFDQFKFLKKYLANETDINFGACIRLGGQFGGMYAVLRLHN